MRSGCPSVTATKGGKSMKDKVLKSFDLITAYVALAIGLFHIANVSGLFAFSDMTIRVVHLMAMMFIVFLRVSKKKDGNANMLDISIAAVGGLLVLLTNFYILSRWKDIAISGGVTNTMDALVGLITVLLVIEATRRATGLVLPLITLVFLVYPFVGQYLPGILKAKDYSFDRTFSFLYTGSQGIYGIPISVSATYIILFCIYGAFLGEFGAGKFLFELSASLTYRFTAAAAKTAIVFSSLIGMISGSAAGNVSIAGSLTIPMMKKEGHRPEIAGAIEAVSSTGGQIMPPVMGAAAFIMAEIIGVPYANIMKAAILPALLYYVSVFIIVDLQARKNGMAKTKGNVEHTKFGEVLKNGWYLALPIVALIIMLIQGYSPFKAAFYSIIALIVVYVISKRKLDKEVLNKILDSLKAGARDTVTIATACAASGIIVGILSMTGLGSKLSTLIITLSNGHLLIALILTMLVSLVLGMGLPTTAAYLVLASVVAPALNRMGMSLIAAHMFVFFFGCISTITPPVALASYVAAGIAGADLNKVGWMAFRFGLVSFILPFAFAFSPSLLMDGPLPTIILTTVLSIVGVFAVATAIVGYFRVNLSLPYRFGLFIAGLLLINEDWITSVIGIALIIGIFIINRPKSEQIKAL